MPAWLQHSLLVLFAAESSKQNNELELDKRVSCLAMKGKCLCCTSSGAFIDSVVQWQRAEHFFVSKVQAVAQQATRKNSLALLSFNHQKLRFYFLRFGHYTFCALNSYPSSESSWKKGGKRSSRYDSQLNNGQSDSCRLNSK
jgi:hypothetical protein